MSDLDIWVHSSDGKTLKYGAFYMNKLVDSCRIPHILAETILYPNVLKYWDT